MVTRRWDPFSGMVSLRDAMDRLLEQSFISPHRSISTDLPGARIMSIDLYERNGDYVMKAYVPGVKVEDIEIHVDRGTLLTIKARVGGKAEQEEAKKYKWLVSELDYGDHSRSVTLPTMVDVNRIEATAENGVLTIILPKAEEAKPKQIKITTK